MIFLFFVSHLFVIMFTQIVMELLNMDFYGIHKLLLLRNVENISPDTCGNFGSDFYYFVEPVCPLQVSILNDIFFQLLSDSFLFFIRKT